MVEKFLAILVLNEVFGNGVRKLPAQ